MITTAGVYFGNQHHSPAIDFQCTVRPQFHEGLDLPYQFYAHVTRDGSSTV